MQDKSVIIELGEMKITVGVSLFDLNCTNVVLGMD